MENRPSIPITPRETVREGKKRIAIAMREPWGVAEEVIELPGPGQFPQPPPPVNLIMMILPPLIMIGGTVIVSLVTGQSNMAVIAPMLVMSLGFPLANIIGQQMAVKKYREQLALRETAYREKLAQARRMIDGKIDCQRKEMEREYPLLKEAAAIALAQGKNQRLWWRRLDDADFLALRVGTGTQPPAVKVQTQNMYDPNDPLLSLPGKLVADFREAHNFPMLVDLKTVGSLMVMGKSRVTTYGVIRKMLLDVIIHHSPEDVRVAVLSDRPELSDAWEWMKWLPHTRALYSGQEKPGLAFTKDSIDTYLLGLKRIYQTRKDQNKNYTDSAVRARPVYVVLVDDSGTVRQSDLVASLAGDGYLYGFYLIFSGEQGTPNQCRSRLIVDERRDFKYLETWNREGIGVSFIGRAELAEIGDCEPVSRALAGLEVAGGQAAYSLPQSVRISSILRDEPFSKESIQKNWQGTHPDDEQMLFPAGVHVTRSGLEEFDIDFRPETYGGKGEYHAMLIGTTGSGKSIFLQSLVLATAHRYSPREINFLFMDFKAGAAELKKISEMPHVVGMITDLGPALAERALKALENELERRKTVFDQAGKITDIWDYNRRYAERAMPHLMVVIDEFAEGIKILPDLVERLRDLGRQGRAFGMYFLLANQEVNFAVENLKSNVGWYIVLKVKRTEEMSLIDRSLPISPGKGRGYIRVKNDITEFQGAYSGSPVITSSLDEANDFVIEKLHVDGSRQVIYKHAPEAEKKGQTSITELEMLLERMTETAKEMAFEPVRRIYLDPLPERVSLPVMFDNCLTYRKYDQGRWTEMSDSSKRLVTPVGMIDIPEDCLQAEMLLDFNKDDGNLWVVGSPGSGKAKTLLTIVQSLAYTHRPDEVQFYILEYGTGSLRVLDNLPHVGAVIRLSEQERLERLIKFLDQVVDRRTLMDNWRDSGEPELFLVINNYAELRTTYPDQADGIARFVTRGKGAGLHLMIATNRGTELNRAVSSNIARRIVLQMATADEYLDIIGKPPPPLSLKAEGRGYFVAGRYCECQICQPEIETSPIVQLGKIYQQMQACWDGQRPLPVATLPNQLPYTELIEEVLSESRGQVKAQAVLGMNYDDLEIVRVNLEEEIPNWLVLGPRQSGKTNFLLSYAYSVYENAPDACEIRAFALRRGPLARLAGQSNLPITVLNTPDDINQECQKLVQRPPTGNPKPYLLLIDDLGAAFEPGRENVAMNLNQLAAQLNTFTDVFVVAACLRDEVQMQLGSPLIRILRQSRTGIAFSKDPSDLDWLGGQLSLSMRKLNFPPGRGLFINKGSMKLIQTPCMDRLNCFS